MFRNLPFRRRWLLLGVPLLGTLAFPVYTTCGASAYTCTSAPDDRGVITRYYEIEPLSINLIETALGTNLGLRYSDGYEEEQLKNWPPRTED